MRYTGQDICECDRCRYKEYLDPASPNQAYWHDVLRITKDGNEHRFLLCKSCYEKYQERMLGIDDEFNLWLGGGK